MWYTEGDIASQSKPAYVLQIKLLHVKMYGTGCDIASQRISHFLLTKVFKLPIQITAHLTSVLPFLAIYRPIVFFRYISPWNINKGKLITIISILPGALVNHLYH